MGHFKDIRFSVFVNSYNNLRTGAAAEVLAGPGNADSDIKIRN